MDEHQPAARRMQVLVSLHKNREADDREKLQRGKVDHDQPVAIAAQPVQGFTKLISTGQVQLSPQLHHTTSVVTDDIDVEQRRTVLVNRS